MGLLEDIKQLLVNDTSGVDPDVLVWPLVKSRYNEIEQIGDDLWACGSCGHGTVNCFRCVQCGACTCAPVCSTDCDCNMPLGWDGLFHVPILRRIISGRNNSQRDGSVSQVGSGGGAATTIGDHTPNNPLDDSDANNSVATDSGATESDATDSDATAEMSE
jgi:hypothetical protein